MDHKYHSTVPIADHNWSPMEGIKDDSILGTILHVISEDK